MTFNNSKAFIAGGAMNIECSHTTFEGNCIITFREGSSTDGGAVYMSESAIIFEGNSTVAFYNNEAYT